MSSIPVLDSCRFTTISSIKERVDADSFTYKSVRIIGKIKILQDIEMYGLCILEDQDDTLPVDIYALKNRSLEVGNEYEIFGEID